VAAAFDSVLLFIREGTPAGEFRRRRNRSIILLSTFSVTSRCPVFRWDDLPLDKVTEMVARKVIAGAHLVMTQAYFKRGAIVPLHVVERETAVYVLQGALRAHVDTDVLTAREGEVLIVPAGAARQTEALDDTFLLSVTR
jgi:quercetin dioxygenase-like cupin family protein